MGMKAASVLTAVWGCLMMAACASAPVVERFVVLDSPGYG